VHAGIALPAGMALWSNKSAASVRARARQVTIALAVRRLKMSFHVQLGGLVTWKVLRQEAAVENARLAIIARQEKSSRLHLVSNALRGVLEMQVL
jgi:hypothetical protein